MASYILYASALLAIIVMRDVDAGNWVYPPDDYESAVNFSLAQPVTESDVKFVNFNTSGVEVSHHKLKNYPTKVLIHGWLTSIEKSPWYSLLKDAYMADSRLINVIYVDYNGPASKKLSIAAPTAINVAKVIANYLSGLNIDVANYHLIGHSLGSHVAGFTGRNLFENSGKKVSRITLLDPAGPKFQKTPERVCKDDATFVDVIHTDDDHYGLSEPTGHFDVYPNGGKNQPGCPSLDVDDNCSHARSTMYFVESVFNPTKQCWPAVSWECFKRGNISDKSPEIFGEHVSHKARGVFFMNTNTVAPFLQ